MSVLIFAIILVLIVALVLYTIDMIPMDGRLQLPLKLLVIVIAILLLCQRAGMV